MRDLIPKTGNTLKEFEIILCEQTDRKSAL